MLDAYVAAVPALLFFGVLAARQQHAYQPIVKDAPAGVRDRLGARLVIVAVILVAAIGANVVLQPALSPRCSTRLPVIGARGVGRDAASLRRWRRPDWSLLPGALKGSVFLLSLVLCASMMPVEQLPPASWQTALGLGFVSAVFDNIPLTALALHAGRLRLGLSGLRGRLRRLDDLVRFVGRRRAVEHVPAGALGRRLAAPAAGTSRSAT